MDKQTNRENTNEDTISRLKIPAVVIREMGHPENLKS